MGLPYYLTRAEDKDIDLLYKWVNDETVRNNSFHSNIITYEEHRNWFLEKTNSQDTDIYIYYYNGEPTGQIRLEYSENKAIIDYGVDIAYRGKGHGSKILTLIEKEIFYNKKEVEYLIGRVKYSNSASQKVFKKMFYSEFPKKDYIEFIKKISLGAVNV